MRGSVTEEQSISRAVENALTVIREHPAERIAIVAYTSDEDLEWAAPEEYKVLQSAETHGAILKAVQERVAQELGKEVILVPFDVEDYTRWLSDRELENDRASRGAWAAWRAGLADSEVGQKD